MNISLCEDNWKVKLVIYKNKPVYRAERKLKPFYSRHGKKFFYGASDKDAIEKGKIELAKLEFETLNKKEVDLFNKAKDIVSYIEKKSCPMEVRELLKILFTQYKPYRSIEYAKYVFSIMGENNRNSLKEKNKKACDLMMSDLDNNDFTLAYFLTKRGKKIKSFELSRYERQALYFHDIL